MNIYVACTALLMVTVSVMSCGSPSRDSENDLDDYLMRLKAIGIETQEREDALVFPFNSPSEADDTKLLEARSYLSGMSENLRATLDEVRALRPPSEVRTQHEETIAGLSQVAALWSDFQSTVAGLSTARAFISALDSFFSSRELSSAAERIDRSCEELQAVAQAAGSQVDLECEL